jgi:tyrosyl-tRNA synthetase
MRTTTDIPPREQVRILVDGCEHVETCAELEERIAAKGRLTVKLGIDPTGSFLHLGHAVVLHKLQQFVELGHRVILIFGDFTGRIGDPTGRNDTRPPLNDEQIALNMRDYREQAGKVLDLERTEIAYNSAWLSKLTLGDMIALLSRVTVAQLLSRNDFAKRYEAATPIALHEFLYPIAQAYDSVAIGADVELGGSDQLFNLLIGREYQQHAGQPKQICMTMHILEGTDGVVRMGKSRGNYIGLSESASEQFGKLMSIPDDVIPRYAQLAAFLPAAEVEAIAEGLGNGSFHPMLVKKRMAELIVARYHGAAEARAARERFEATVQRGELPSEMPQVRARAWRSLAEALVDCGFAQSKREAERLIAGGGVKLDGIAVHDPRQPWKADASRVLSVGTRRFARIVPDAGRNS